MTSRTLRAAAALSIIIAAAQSLGAQAGGSRGLGIGSAPAWVRAVERSREASPPASAYSGGQYLLLSDSQDNVATQESFRHIVLKVVSDSGAQSASKVEADWDPEYESIVFHELRVIRGERSFDRLARSAFRVIQREEDLELSMYDGRLSALAFLPDVRSGDVVEYAYTVTGRNPAFGGLYSGAFDMAFSEPVAALHCSVLSPAGRALKVRAYGGAPQPQRAESGGSVLLSWRLEGVKPYEDEGDSPAWFDPVPWVQVEEWKDWAQVASWSASIFSPRAIAGPLAKAEAARIAGRYPDKASRALAATRFVQDEIRYLGIEAGISSHVPELPEATLSKRAGDCKAKALLLSVLLSELGTAAYPALTDSGWGRGLDGLLPSPSDFDHVVLAIPAGEGFTWVDPTMSHQRGALGANELPGCERALLSRAGQDRLLEIPPARGKLSCEEAFDLSVGADGRGRLSVSTRYEGREADDMRYALATESLDDISAGYADYYRDLYPGTDPLGSLAWEDDASANAITVRETYALPPGLSLGQEGGSPSLEAGIISEYLRTARDGVRGQPFALAFPAEAEHRVSVRPLRVGSYPALNEAVADPAFALSFRTGREGERLFAEWKYESRSDHVEAIDYPAFARNAEKALSLLSYEPEPSAKTANSPAAAWVIPLLLVSLLALCAVGAVFLHSALRVRAAKRGAAADGRFVGLETRLAYQEKSLADMSAQAFEDSKRIERLEALVRDMNRRMKETQGDGPPLPEGEKPPHY
jgi:uncharacterized coiled-coil protein SlyX